MHSLTIALEKVDFLPPNRVTDDTSILTLKNLVFEPLCRWRDGQALPGLLHRWEHDAEGRRWRFQVRPATFHDGVRCDSGHVLAFIQAILDSRDTFGMPWAYSRYLQDVRLSTPSPTCLEVDSPRPLADILDLFSEFYLCRVNDDGLPVVGTGPYRVEHVQPRQQAILQRVGAGETPQRLSFMQIADADARYQALRAGVVDAALNLERMPQAADFDPAWAWQRKLNTLSVMQYLNCSTGLFQHPAARLAANLALDQQALIDEVMHGLGQPSSTIVSPYHLGFASARPAPLPYDPQQARRLLDTLDDSPRLTLRSPLYMPDRAVQISRYVQQALEAVGLQVTLDIQQDRPEYAREVGRKAMGDIAIFDSSPHSTYRILSDKISSRVQGTWWQGFHDETLETLISEANRSVAPQAREQAYGRCLNRLNQNPPWLYLFHPVEVLASRPGLAGLRLGAKGDLHFIDPRPGFQP